MVEKLFQIFDELSIGLITLSDRYEIKEMNRSAVEILNLGSVIKGQIDLVHPDLKPEGEKKKVLRDYQGKTIKVMWWREDNHSNANGGMFWIAIIDISAAERDKTRLASLIQILDSIDEGIMASDESGMIFAYNRAAERLEGMLREDIVGKSGMEIWGGKGKQNDHSIILKSGQPILNKYKKITTQNGKKIDLVLNKFPITEDGKIKAAYSIIRDVTKLRQLLDNNVSLQQKIYAKSPRKLENNTRYSFSDILGKSNEFMKVIEQGYKAARASCSVLIVGETGTGKELFVQSIHNASLLSHEPFIPINCAAIPENLLEGLLFGTVKGAFTGAGDNVGLFEQAGHGTLFLDEVNSMKIDLQAKMLRALQERKIRRVGGKDEISVNCRIISSMNSDPLKAIESGSLRSDLYYRIAAVTLYIPPLRERKDDIPRYIDFFIKKYNEKYGYDVQGVSEELLAALQKYNWPGNVRELEHFIEGSMNMVEGEGRIGFEQLPTYLQDKLLQDNIDYAVGQLADSPDSLNGVLLKVEKKVLKAVLTTHGGNVTRAAKALGLGRQNMHYRMKKFGIRSEDFAGE